MGSFFSAPKVDTKAPEVVKEDKSKTKLARKSLFATSGDRVGEELSAGSVDKRSSFFGN